MIVEYKKIIHIDKRENKSKHYNEDRISYKTYWDDKDHIIYCCDKLDKAMSMGFVGLKFDNRDNMSVDWEQRKTPAEQPWMSIMTMECDCDGGNEEFYPIAFCPFCGTPFQFKCVEIREVLHKEKVNVITKEEREQYTVERIIE